jgi:Leucine-rich repeat (LRR) protein
MLKLCHQPQTSEPTTPNQKPQVPDLETPIEQELRVRENQLTALPDQIFKLCFLQILDVSRNKLQEVPALLGDLKELRVLDLSHNQITTFQLSQVAPYMVP